ncbi:EAL domain-containing protein [Pseudomonas sp. R5(2019)]|uniref:EAL domain-containing protein n=1 Tax=Pseudomonas sp. R5(2019) TaxID=2697566 RepID=UPI001412F87E|nr:EAL domain-containing protein [Pseudomonas sp. R5(2019)]NBA93442.1 EAL domain-containing protein [Pseudomonas sp. R5(2019)]
MPLSVKHSRRTPVRLALPWLMGTVPLLLGLFILHWQAERELHARAWQTAEQALAQFNLMLDNVAASTELLLPLAGQPCDGVKLALREQVTRRPFVRSTNVAYKHHLYCNSLFGDYSETINPADYVDGKLRLMHGNPITPDQALLVYRQSMGEQTAMASLDGFHLANALRMIGQGEDLVLQVGPVWLSADGAVHDTPVPAYAVAATSRVSGRYPFSVHTGFAEGEPWRLMMAHYPALFGLLLFFGILTGGVCHWILMRPRSPHQELQRALEANEFIPFFQPVVRGEQSHWAGAEVLMRWQHPREGLVRPDLFIPLAEDSGLIVPMTRALMQQTAAQLAPHADAFEDGFRIGINICASHCQDLNLYDDCRAFLAAFAPGRVTLMLELTERELILPTDTTLLLFEKLHELGVLIAIDDFGTGHSSLAYLRQFNVDYLKIDQSFVATIGVDTLSGHLLDTIIELSAKLDLGIVAEGVETTEQKDYLLQRGVDFLQGYLFGKPLPLNEFIALLANQPDKTTNTLHPVAN